MLSERRNGIEFWLNDFKDRNTERNVAFDDWMRRPMRRGFVLRDYLPTSRMQHYNIHCADVSTCKPSGQKRLFEYAAP